MLNNLVNTQKQIVVYFNTPVLKRETIFSGFLFSYRKTKSLPVEDLKRGKREHVECDALIDWKLNIFIIIDRRFSFYSQNTNMLPRKPKISYRYLKSGIEEFHRKYVLVPADKAANNVVVV